MQRSVGAMCTKQNNQNSAQISQTIDHLSFAGQSIENHNVLTAFSLGYKVVGETENVDGELE